MSKKQVYNGQSLLNKAVECTGNVENAFAMALLNGISITDNLIIGDDVLTPRVTNAVVANYFKEKLPATAIGVDQETVLIPELGIGTMVIGSTFIVG